MELPFWAMKIQIRCSKKHDVNRRHYGRLPLPYSLRPARLRCASAYRVTNNQRLNRRSPTCGTRLIILDQNWNFIVKSIKTFNLGVIQFINPLTHIHCTITPGDGRPSGRRLLVTLYAEAQRRRAGQVIIQVVASGGRRFTSPHDAHNCLINK